MIERVHGHTQHGGAAALTARENRLFQMLRQAAGDNAVLEKLLIDRVAPAVSVKDLARIADLPWAEQPATVFGP